jgi:hypothetical protein
MKWVKASERLPEVGKFLNLRLLDNKSPRCGKLRSDGFFKTDTSLFYKSNIEWLDESASSSNEDYVASNSNTDDTSLVSHSCTDGNSIEQ